MLATSQGSNQFQLRALSTFKPFCSAAPEPGRAFPNPSESLVFFGTCANAAIPDCQAKMLKWRAKRNRKSKKKNKRLNVCLIDDPYSRPAIRALPGLPASPASLNPQLSRHLQAHSASTTPMDSSVPAPRSTCRSENRRLAEFSPTSATPAALLLQ